MLASKMKIDAAVADSEAVVPTIEGQFPKAARHPLGPEIRYRVAGVQVVAGAGEVEVSVAESVVVVAEAVGHPVAAGAQSGTEYCTE